MDTKKSKGTVQNLLLLSLAALGVVYGDIGTSPLYAVNEIFFGHAHTHIVRSNILGAISLVFWALTMIVSFKYIVFVLRADNEGEGGVFALYSLLRHIKSKFSHILTFLLVIAAGLLFGDGIITPAISVISAVEGLKVATPIFTPYIGLITVIILTGLFVIQKKGTSKIGVLFGPIIIVWFVCIGSLGFSWIMHSPQILEALNPIYAIQMISSLPLFTVFLIFGSVMLAVTGGEAMYADMGHFGAVPIRFSWFIIVYPALILNYFGQGAYLLSGREIAGDSIFYSMVPSWGIYPMVLLATFATIIASQALISGAFSLATQAISLGLFPYLHVAHTNDKHEGQIYVPSINWLLYIGCVTLVILFRTSNRLASAYGLAVSGVMLITSLSMIEVATEKWKWSKIASLGLFMPLVAFESVFLVSNSLKFIDGGYVPLGIALVFFIIMQTWKWGRSKVHLKYNSYSKLTVTDLIQKKEAAQQILSRSAIMMTRTFITSKTDRIPELVQVYLERRDHMPLHIIFLTIAIVKDPHRLGNNKYEIVKLHENNGKGSITSVKVSFGFMENPDVESILEELASHHEIKIEEDYRKWMIYAIHERIVLGSIENTLTRLKFNLFRFMSRNTETADHYFQLGIKQPLSIETLPVTIN